MKMMSNNSQNFLLTNKRGGYLALGNSITQYQGLFFFIPEEWDLYKTIENIRTNSKTKEVINRFSHVERINEKGKEEFWFFRKTLIYENEGEEINIDLDFRRVHDYDTKGRIYKIYVENDYIVIEYNKYSDDNLKELLETKYMIIKGANKFFLVNEWVKKEYPYDKKRGIINELYIYKALRVKDKKTLVFTFSEDKEKAIMEAENSWHDTELIKNNLRKYNKSILTKTGVVQNTAIKALDNLIININQKNNITGIFAGLPWFYQFWARDELISIIGLITEEKYSLAKDIIFRYINGIGENGRLSNRLPAAHIGNADAIGWLFKRLYDLLTKLDKHKILREYFTPHELREITKVLEGTIDKLNNHYLKEGMIWNDKRETWMDTNVSYDYREGYRIEIQALTLGMYKTLQYLYRLTKESNGKNYKKKEKELLENTRKNMFKEGMLWDGFYEETDKTTRPNIFIAHYIYPELLSKKEWKQVFDKALENLWLEWGGLASIDKKNPLYKGEHTGFDNESYHRGDSWYFINCIAAISMRRVDKEYFNKYIKKIKEAIIIELNNGWIGQVAELSSANRQDSSGCLAQAWSAAMFIELLNER
jgi:glycogen debranching enzyme